MMLTAVNGGLDRRSLLVDDGRRLTDLVDVRRRRSSFDVLSTVGGRR